MRIKLLFIIMLCGMFLSGCVKAIPIDEEQSDLIAEYMTDTILDHWGEYEEALIYPNEQDSNSDNEINDTDTVNQDYDENCEGDEEKVSFAESEASSQAITTDYISLYDNMGYGNFDIKISEYYLCDEYPYESTNDYFLLEASNGKQLIVISFDITNTSKKDSRFNLIGSNINYELVINEKEYLPMMTLLTNDIQFINLQLASKETKSAVIVFEVLRDIEVSEITLNISNRNIKSTTKLK